MGQSDYDSPRKDAMDLLFDSYMALFFPSARAIDWSRGFEFFDEDLMLKWSSMWMRAKWNM